MPDNHKQRMTEEIDVLKKRLADLDQEIAETEARLPAHSVKPPVMHELLALEDERDALIKKIRHLNMSGEIR